MCTSSEENAELAQTLASFLKKLPPAIYKKKLEA